VLLLLIQHGANGLNLLEAQHVVLVEPLLNPAAEAQAVSRVHRIGQEKRTLVHRFIVCSFSFSFLLFVFC
jgi:E3 ubiquitin-protein ligase SHPRH